MEGKSKMKIANSFLAAGVATVMATTGAAAADLYGGMKGGGMKDMGYAPAHVYSPLDLYLRGDATWSSQSVGEV